MRSTRLQPFPWSDVPRVALGELSERADVLGRLRHAVDEQAVVPALRRLFGDELEVASAPLQRRPEPSDASAASDAALVLDWPGVGLRCRTLPESDLLTAAVSRLLGESFELGWVDAGMEATLRGVGAALVLDVARRATRSEAPTLREAAPAKQGPGLTARVSIAVAGRQYGVQVELERLPTRRSAPLGGAGAPLSRLGELPIRVPWVAGLTSVFPAQLAALAAGDLWLPGDGWLDARAPASAGTLGCPGADWGLAVRVSGGRTVLGAKLASFEPLVESSMSRDASDVEQVVGEVPVVVRLELGALEMSASRWAALRPGDVVQSGRRIEEPVILRAAGREIARGELVDVEGEIGVRITEVLLASSPSSPPSR